MSEVTSLQSIEHFCRAAETLSFTKAAAALALTPAAVSRGVARLEERLGVQLFRRSTRQIALTDDGRVFYEQCTQALAQIDNATRLVRGERAEPKGLLRVSLPSTYAHYRLVPSLSRFSARYPDIELELHVSNRNIDFVDEGFDVAIRLGSQPDSRLVARKLEDAAVGFYASDNYLRAYGTPKLLDELRRPTKHRLLPFTLPSTGRVMPWLAIERGDEVEFVAKSHVRITEDPLACVACARAGLGIVQTFRWIAEAGTTPLTEILTKHSGRSRPFYALYPANKHLSAKVRAWVDFLSEIAAASGTGADATSRRISARATPMS